MSVLPSQLQFFHYLQLYNTILCLDFFDVELLVQPAVPVFGPSLSFVVSISATYIQYYQ